jgi:hypothetical protein
MKFTATLTATLALVSSSYATSNRDKTSPMSEATERNVDRDLFERKMCKLYDDIGLFQVKLKEFCDPVCGTVPPQDKLNTFVGCKGLDPQSFAQDPKGNIWQFGDCVCEDETAEFLTKFGVAILPLMGKATCAAWSGAFEIIAKEGVNFAKDLLTGGPAKAAFRLAGRAIQTMFETAGEDGLDGFIEWSQKSCDFDPNANYRLVYNRMTKDFDSFVDEPGFGPIDQKFDRLRRPTIGSGRPEDVPDPIF